jgi:hypothetical protein
MKFKLTFHIVKLTLIGLPNITNPHPNTKHHIFKQGE